jgi:carboxylesterase
MDDDTQDPTVAAEHPSYKETVTLAARSLVLDLIPHVRHHLPGITTPALLLQGRQDRTIPSDSMSLIYSELGSRDKQMAWLEPSGHLALEDYAKAEAFRLIAGFIESHNRALAKGTVGYGRAQ